jgi:hypothetical protein
MLRFIQIEQFKEKMMILNCCQCKGHLPSRGSESLEQLKLRAVKEHLWKKNIDGRMKCRSCTAPIKYPSRVSISGRVML